jgi:L-asparaginase II
LELDPTAEPTHAALPDPFASDAPVAAVWRGDLIESVHYGRYVFCDTQGERKDSLGDCEGYVYLRSSAKPFQALPLIFSGAADAFGLTSEELAVACASHSAEPRHLAAVRSILRKAGLSESDLQNGTHPPRHALAAARLARNGETPRPIHGNCSGKHAGMLTVCVYAGWDPASYRDPEGPLQKLVRRTVAKLCGIEPEAIRIAGDGCGVPVFALPLQNLALGFARLSAGGAKDFPEDLLEAICRVRDAMRAHPFMVAGTGRFDTSIMEESDLIAKSGAEGIFAAGSPEGWGLALKISDGASRAVASTALAVLNRKGVRVPMEIEVGTMKDLHGKAVGKVAPLLQNNP